MANGLKLWSKRFSTSKGLHWKYERDVDQFNQKDWIKIYSEDEPNIYFLVSSSNMRKKTPIK